MQLVTCHAGGSRFAIESRHVIEVLPRLSLHRLGGSPPWFPGLLICRGAAIGVIDLVQLVEGRPCRDHLGSRIVLARIERESAERRVGILAERVGLDCREFAFSSQTAETNLGRVALDDQGPFQLIDPARLVNEDRGAILFAGR